MIRKVLWLLSFSLIAFAATGLSVSAANGIPCGNPHTATAAEIAAGYPADSEVCPGDEKTLTPESGAAKQYLQSIFNDGSGRCSNVTPQTDKIGALNPSFSICAAKFLQAVRQQDPNIRITSAYRTTEQQRCMCGDQGSSGCAGAGRSNHQLGIAVDLSARNFAWLHSQIERFPGLRYLTISNDPYHMEAVKGGPCVTPGYNPPDFTASPVTSSLPFDDSVRRALGVPPPPPPPSSPLQQQLQPPPATQTQTQSNPQQVLPSLDTLNSTPFPAGTCAPQTRCVQSDGNIYYRATTCVDQVYRKCPAGCTGLICNATSTGSSSLGTLLSPTVTNDNTNKNTKKNATSTFDLIDFFANPPTATNVGTATPIDITNAVQDAGNTSVLQPPSVGVPRQIPPQSPGAGYGPVPPQTFTSADLSSSPGSYNAQASTFQGLLANMQTVLLSILNHLQPFGGRIIVQQNVLE